MHKFLLTIDNIDAIKLRLRDLYPAVKSSHLSEAMARALGYKSHAALKVALSASKKSKLSLVSFSCEKLLDWLATKDYALDRVLPDSILNSLPLPLWRRIHGAKYEDKVRLKNNWFLVCEKNNMPYVYITVKTKYTSVDWDYISVDESHDPKKFTSEDTEKILSLFHQYKNAKSSYNFSVFVGSITGLEEAQAQNLASDIFDLLHAKIGKELQFVA